MPYILRAADLSSAEPVQFIIAHEWQHMVLAEKAGLCDNLSYDEMRDIALKSGMVLFLVVKFSNMYKQLGQELLAWKS